MSYTLQVVCPSILTYHDIQDDKLFIAILLIESYLFKRIENLKTFENIFQKIERIVTKYERYAFTNGTSSKIRAIEEEFEKKKK